MTNPYSASIGPAEKSGHPESAAPASPGPDKSASPGSGESAALKAGDLLAPLTVVDLTVDGLGLARHEGRVIFLDGGLPGARVSAVIRQVKAKVLFADITAHLSPSPHEIAPACPHAALCGGCSLLHFAPSAALEWKAGHIRQCLARIAKAPETPVLPLSPSPKNRAFRNKMSFAFGSDAGGRCLLGLRQRKGHGIVEVTSCLSAGEPAMEMLALMRQRVNELGLEAWNRGSGYLRHLVLRLPDAGLDAKAGAPLLECITGPDHDGKCGGQTNALAVAAVGKEMMSRFALRGFIHSEKRGRDEKACGDRPLLVLGEKHFQERLGPLILDVPYNSFLQTNTGAALALYEHIEREAGLREGDVLWDLFCGVGGIALFLAKRAGLVYGCDIADESVAAARHNSRVLGLDNCRFQQADLDAGFGKSWPAPDVIVLDPPRAGISAALAKDLLGLKARTMLYVSCDAGTQARDALRLAPCWRPLKALPVDMFPHTPHVENLLVLTRRD